MQAFSLYEDEISDSRAQLAAIILIIATFQQMTCFSEKDHNPVCPGCGKAAEAAISVQQWLLHVNHLFLSGASRANMDKPTKDGKKLLDCLKKGLKVLSIAWTP